MTSTAEKLLSQILALDEVDRLEITDRLTESLEASTDPEYLAAWDAEIEKRLADIDSGRAKMIPAAEAIRIIRMQAGCDDQVR